MLSPPAPARYQLLSCPTPRQMPEVQALILIEIHGKTLKAKGFPLL